MVLDMSRALKPKDNCIDSSAVVHNKENLKDILTNLKGVYISAGNEQILTTTMNLTIFGLGKDVTLAGITLPTYARGLIVPYGSRRCSTFCSRYWWKFLYSI